MSMPADCCLKGFAWEGTPTGTETRINTNDTYVAGSNPKVALVVIHDLFGWKWGNLRLLADHYAVEADATVYLPDFFGGASLDTDLIFAGRFAELDLPNFMGRNTKEVREPEMVAFIKTLRARGFEKVGAIGYCYGGWAVFRLAGAEAGGKRLVDCVTAGHPSLLTKEEIEGVRSDVAVQMLAPEHDIQYTAELKTHTFVTLQKLGVPFDYQHFPGVEHACFTRGDEKVPGDRAALVRGKNAAVAWAKQWLHEV
ncbi:dienelactone hydrolase family protein [Coniochaeta ligniaria NRRL 30616]|uniref:Dienelactone hydrolase family protein n=1 Tax=Coniochaeta ligniaria NRRL 30616 TaxID=1408157 RepID=A0A1J7JAN5_9PEZI|nr:dienelactone hydrolase family protein [Coniochaeta ligniaria NRRL 30616]